MTQFAIGFLQVSFELLGLSRQCAPHIGLIQRKNIWPEQVWKPAADQLFRALAEPRQTGLVGKHAPEFTVPECDHAGQRIRNGPDECFALRQQSSADFRPAAGIEQFNFKATAFLRYEKRPIKATLPQMDTLLRIQKHWNGFTRSIANL